jgi:hypothetical protein
LEHLGHQVRSRLAACNAEQRREVPSLRVLYDELMATAAEFEDWQLNAAEISVTTEPITLDEIELGPFQIRLHLDRLGNDVPYSVTALEPNPAASCEETTHPHVSGERLCPAYVELDRWYGVSCHDCDSSINEEDTCTCTNCDEKVCGDCLISCGGCGDGYCSGCIERCGRCEEYSCSGCLVRCAGCRHHVCEACREDDLCETCRNEMEEEQDETESDDASIETPVDSTEPTV